MARVATAGAGPAHLTRARKRHAPAQRHRENAPPLVALQARHLDCLVAAPS
ncbi:MAG: hypothetical protein ACREIR_11615 [Geminicoccaceae bacterium]